MHPDPVAALAAEHRRDMLRHADAHRLAMASRPKLRWQLQSLIVRRPRAACGAAAQVVSERA